MSLLHKHLTNKQAKKKHKNISQASEIKKSLFIQYWFIQDYLRVLKSDTDGKIRVIIQILHKLSVKS